MAASKRSKLFKTARARFNLLCRIYNMPFPAVKPAAATDRCDFTSPPEVRLNIEAWRRNSPDMSLERYVVHNFCHYICGLEEDGDEELSNKVANLIAEWLLKDG